MIRPSNIRELINRIRNWEDAGDVFSNSGWLIADNLARMLLAVGVSAALARGLGAEDLGALRATLALVTLCSSFTNLGLYGIVVKSLTQEPEKAPETLGTTAVLYVVGSLISAAACVGVAVWSIDEVHKLLLVLIFTVGVLFHAPRVYVVWFQAKVRSKYTVYAQGIPSILSGIGVVVAAVAGAPLVVFAILIVSDTVLQAISLTVLGAKAKSVPKSLSFKLGTAKTLLSQSYPLVAASVAVKVYLKVDQLMLERMITDEAVGIYSVAADISEVWYFMPKALATSALAGIVYLYTKDVEAYRSRMQDLLDLMVLVSFAIVVVVFVVAPTFITLVYGAAYSEAGAILRVHILAAPFIFMGTILSKSIITEGYFEFSLMRHTSGAVVNVLLNLWLIPEYGGIGAAWATVISYATAAYLATVLYPKARPMFRQMSRAFALPFR